MTDCLVFCWFKPLLSSTVNPRPHRIRTFATFGRVTDKGEIIMQRFLSKFWDSMSTVIDDMGSTESPKIGGERMNNINNPRPKLPQMQQLYGNYQSIWHGPPTTAWMSELQNVGDQLPSGYAPYTDISGFIQQDTAMLALTANASRLLRASWESEWSTVNHQTKTQVDQLPEPFKKFKQTVLKYLKTYINLLYTEILYLW